MVPLRHLIVHTCFPAPGEPGRRGDQADQDPAGKAPTRAANFASVCPCFRPLTPFWCPQGQLEELVGTRKHQQELVDQIIRQRDLYRDMLSRSELLYRSNAAFSHPWRRMDLSQ